MKENFDTISVLNSQLKNELTEAAVYARLAKLEKNPKNRRILESISADEASHAHIIAEILGKKGEAASFKVSWTVFCARVFGITFTLKAMERGENTAGKTYRKILQMYPQLAIIADDEERHEAELIDMLNDERLNNMGAIVLGLNDALVELTGALAGFTFAIGDCAKIAKLGLITGLAAAMSMAASAFLSARADAQAGGESNAEFLARVARVMDKLAARHPGEDILCVTHGGFVCKALKYVLKYVSVPVPPCMDNTAIFAFRTLDGKNWQLLCWNDSAHLENAASCIDVSAL
jgi:VIT1/CCC1 family predicted Fe2+/Mn2+ transporter